MNYKKLLTICFSIILIASQAGSIFPLGSLHTYHTSLTRIKYNSKEKLVEISVQLFTHDLTPTLERRTRKRIDYEKAPDIDKIIFDYLNEKFVLKDKNGAAKKLVWVGKEVEVDTVYIHVETASEEDLENFSLQNTLFFESFPEQTNLVTIRYSEKKADLLFKVGDKHKEIKSLKPIE
ncbi:MAG TPA: DUF6702 family protein [Pyrinomonadaceae bacterium]|nr:DUF6702 family protein [Pyrinomonadaceae bacterium]